VALFLIIREGEAADNSRVVFASADPKLIATVAHAVATRLKAAEGSATISRSGSAKSGSK
jgi:hypothetical protein